jgi:inositol phosphorylceramide mannosyltransferase catalytic subunit
LIPRVVHHVWPGDDAFRPEPARLRATWLAHHPDWTFRFWRTELGDLITPDVHDLLADPRYSVVVKSDVARYELLRLHGGIYVDSDMECLRPFDDLLGVPCFIGRESDDFLCPSLIGCVPGHPLLDACAREALARVRAAGPERANREPNTISGPSLLTELARAHSDVVVHPPSHFYPIPWWETERLHEATPHAYAKHWWHGTGERGWARAGARAPLDHPIRYDLGGLYPRAGYVTVNLAPGADRCCDITQLDLLHPADGEVDEFLLEHTLEHVPVTRYVRFLDDLHRKLCIGGRVVVVQTDAAEAIRQHASGALSFRSLRAVLFTPEDRLAANPLHAHHNMWSAEELARDFRAIGFMAETFDAGSWRFDMSDRLHAEDVSRDHGKPIRNLGVRAVRTR